MNILLCGPVSLPIINCLKNNNHNVMVTEEQFDTNYLSIRKINFCISYRYRHIIKSKEINFLSGKLINLHISMLPFGRGADPNIWSYLENSPHGVSIHNIDAGIDSGDILLQEKVHINYNNDTLATSYTKLSHAVETLFIKNFNALLGLQIPPQRQEGEGTYHKSSDKDIYKHLWSEKMWDTPVSTLLRRGQ